MEITNKETEKKRQYPLEGLLFGLIICIAVGIAWCVNPQFTGEGTFERVNFIMHKWVALPLATLIGPIFLIVGFIKSIKYFRLHPRELIPSKQGTFRVAKLIAYTILAIGSSIILWYITYNVTMWVIGWDLVGEYSNVGNGIVGIIVFLTGLIGMCFSAFYWIRMGIKKES